MDKLKVTKKKAPDIKSSNYLTSPSPKEFS